MKNVSMYGEDDSLSAEDVSISIKYDSFGRRRLCRWDTSQYQWNTLSLLIGDVSVSMKYVFVFVEICERRLNIDKIHSVEDASLSVEGVSASIEDVSVSKKYVSPSMEDVGNQKRCRSLWTKH